jgi:hypothetical protein
MASIPKPDGGIRIIHVFGKGTDVGQDAQVVAKVLKPVLEAEAIRRFANCGVIWHPSQTVWHCMEAHLGAPGGQTLSADIKTAFWRVRQNAVYRILRSCGLGQRMAALVSRQMCDVVPGMEGRRLLMGHPLAPVMLALWVATVARKEIRFLHLLGATITWYVDNITVSWRNRWVGGKVLRNALNQSGILGRGRGRVGPDPGGVGSPIPEGDIIPYPGKLNPVSEGGIQTPDNPVVELSPGLLMRVFAPTPIRWKKKNGRAWSSWLGRELGLVRIGGARRARAQQHRRREGRKWAVRTYIRARALLTHRSPVVREHARRQMAVAIGTLTWYTQASPLSRVGLKATRHGTANRAGATLRPKSTLRQSR